MTLACEAKYEAVSMRYLLGLLSYKLQKFLILLLCIISSMVPSAYAQSRGVSEIPDPQVVLKQVKLLSESQEKTLVQIEFYPRTPVYQVLRDFIEPAAGSSAFTIRFNNSRRNPNSSQRNFKGVLSDISFNEEARDLVLNFSTEEMSRLTVDDLGPSLIQISFDRVSQRSGSSYNNYDGNDFGSGEDFQGSDEEEFELIILKYADVSEVVGLLTQGVSVRPNNTFILREPGFGSPGSGNNETSSISKEENNDQPLGESVDRNLAINRRLNAIWVRGSRSHIEKVRRQIELIDIPVDSVILETEFVELSETGSRNIGVDYGNGAGAIGIGTLRSGEFAPNFDPENRSNRSFSLQAALYAQIQKGEGRIISKPRIAAQSGSTAKIITGDALPILTAITLSGVNGVSQQVEYVNVGVTLQIAPRISPDGFVTSKIYAVVSSVTGNSQGFPTISQREAETSASVRDGESFVIGGLIQDSNIETNTKVPFLGDIPLVKNLFRREVQSTTKTELYIIITPTIVRHGKQLQGQRTTTRTTTRLISGPSSDQEPRP